MMQDTRDPELIFFSVKTITLGFGYFFILFFSFNRGSHRIVKQFRKQRQALRVGSNVSFQNLHNLTGHDICTT